MSLVLQDKCNIEIFLSPVRLYTGNPQRGTLANSEDPGEVPQRHFIWVFSVCLKIKQSSGTGVH